MICIKTTFDDAFTHQLNTSVILIPESYDLCMFVQYIQVHSWFLSQLEWLCE